MLLYEIIWKRHTAINQLAKGLKQQEVLQIMRKHPDNFAERFVASKLPLSADKRNGFYFAKQRRGGESEVIF